MVLRQSLKHDQDPSTRKIKVLTIGAGLSGIQLAYQIQKHCENVEHVIYEKNADIGGTWLENRYPGKIPHLKRLSILLLLHTVTLM